MPGLFDLEEHLVFYRSYHFNHTNVAIHLICIPIILLSAISMLSPIGSSLWLNLGTLLSFVYGLYYIMLDWRLGVPTFAGLISYSYYTTNYYLSLDKVTQSIFIKWAIGAHVISWALQIFGHQVYEKRSPALLDNLAAALVLAPYFVVFEIAFFLGYRSDLKKSMDNKAGVNISKFRSEQRKKNN